MRPTLFIICSVSVASMDDAFDKIHITPLYLGHRAIIGGMDDNSEQ